MVLAASQSVDSWPSADDHHAVGAPGDRVCRAVSTTVAARPFAICNANCVEGGRALQIASLPLGIQTCRPADRLPRSGVCARVADHWPGSFPLWRDTCLVDRAVRRPRGRDVWRRRVEGPSILDTWPVLDLAAGLDGRGETPRRWCQANQQRGSRMCDGARAGPLYR